jgi:hypothetical protein
LAYFTGKVVVSIISLVTKAVLLDVGERLVSEEEAKEMVGDGEGGSILGESSQVFAPDEWTILVYDDSEYDLSRDLPFPEDEEDDLL